nr:MAG TPA: Chitin-binding domain type 3 [Caudoviricetes sp.]
MEIKLKDGGNFKINSYQKDSFEMIIPLNKVYDTAILMSQNNVSHAKIIDYSIGNGNIIYEFETVKMLGFDTKVIDSDNVSIRFTFEEIPAAEMELAELRSRMELQRTVFLIGMNHASPEDVIRLCDELDTWNGFKFPYRKGERFKYKGKPYEAIIDHVSQANKTPDKEVALYKEITKENKPTYLEWEKGKEYNKGDKVIYQGSIYECTWDKNTREPTGLGWKKI